MCSSSAALPLPEPKIPDNFPLPPYVVTSGGKKLPLGHVKVQVRFDTKTQTLRSSHPGWWIVNHPLSQIDGLTTAAAEELFGRPPHQIMNWYFREPGEPKPEPDAPSGPAPIKNLPPTVVVKAGESIAAAVVKAKPGSVIQVRPGIYREQIVARVAGLADKPIVLEGVRDEHGRTPVISGNLPAPANAWTEIQPGLWRAAHWAERASNLSWNGRLLRERTVPEDLSDGEYCHNYASRELAYPRLAKGTDPQPGRKQLGDAWRRQSVDADGMLQLGERRGVFYLSTWLWLPPGRQKTVWDPRFPQPLTGEVHTKGPLRAGRQSGTRGNTGMNLYRLWLNGELMPAAGMAGEPRARTNYGFDSDKWTRLPFREGWNHLVVLLDSSKRTKHRAEFRFNVPKGFSDTASRAERPDDLGQPDGRKADHVSEWLVLGPLADAPAAETAVYLRLPKGVNPNQELIDAGAFENVLSLNAPYWTVRGFEFVHGAQYQQRALVSINAAGVTIEHCQFREPEVRCLSLALSKWDQADPPAVVRGNWFLSPGSLGIGASGSSEKLTAENQSAAAPGRGRALIEFNTIINNNRAGYDRFWESGAMKFFRLTGCVIRHNTILDGDGPGIWLDWEHYNNRLEGNFIRGATGFALGIEASPGPNLIANNVVVDIKPGGAWFQYGLLAWSSARIWTVGNTVVTEHGAMFAEGGNNRGTIWKALPERNAALLNNLIIGDPVSIHRGRIGWAEGNQFHGPKDSGLHRYSRWADPDYGQRVESGPQMGGPEPPAFKDKAGGDLRTESVSETGVRSLPIQTQGQSIDPISHVRHDHHGLLRFPEDPVPSGAFRAEKESQLEIEWQDGTMERR